MVVAPEIGQMYVDMGFIPDMVSNHIPEQYQDGALKMCRQVNGVTTYLSWMALGAPRHAEAALFAVGVAGMDVVTDERNVRLSDGVVDGALAGEPEYPELEPLALASDMAQNRGFDDSIRCLAHWQDVSLRQFEDPPPEELYEITRGKGGYSALAHLQSMKEDIDATEADLMIDFGETMQLLDDYLDRPKDIEEGISTLPASTPFDSDDLLAQIEYMEDRLADYYGDKRSVKRFGRVMRAHRRLGMVENRRPGTAERFLPWYF